jgi:hypothetical protein
MVSRIAALGVPPVLAGLGLRSGVASPRIRMLMCGASSGPIVPSLFGRLAAEGGGVVWRLPSVREVGFFADRRVTRGWAAAGVIAARASSAAPVARNRRVMRALLSTVPAS